jgi:aryl-alcohol dehydrogenase-like predicted oxidoreductase
MPELPKRTLGRTGLPVTVLGLGAGNLKGPPREVETSEEQAERVLNAALDAGVNYIETSHDARLSEERIGRYLSNRRDEFLLCTKCGCLAGFEPGPNERLKHEFTRENVIAGVELSLSRLRTDHIDVLLFHTGPTKQQLEEHGALEAALELQQQGKVRVLGISSQLPQLTEQLEMGAFDVFQLPYSALQRQHEDFMSQAAKSGAGIVVYGGAAKGDPGRQEGDRWQVWQSAALDELLEPGMSRMEFTLRFTCTNPDVATTVVATTSPDHMRENVEAVSKGPLPADVYEEAQRRLNAAGLTPAG